MSTTLESEAIEQFMTLDVAAMRRDTPGCAAGLTHFNNAGASLMPRRVMDSVCGHLELEARIGGYEAAVEAERGVAAFYRAAARLVNGAPDEIAYVDSATRGWHNIFHAFHWREGDVILTSRAEYNSNIISFRHAQKRFGVRTDLVPDDANGTIDLGALERRIDKSTRLIAISHMPTNDGLVNPAKEIGDIAAAHGIPYLLDACQSGGQMPLDVAAINCTMLTVTGRKYLRGPRGTGFLWVRRDWLPRLAPYALDTRSARWLDVERFEIVGDARKFELWESGVAGQIGLGAAIDYALELGLDSIWERIKLLSAAMRAAIALVPGLTVHDQGVVKSGIVTFSHRSLDAGAMIDRLRSDFSVNTSLSSTQLTRTELIASGVDTVVRASVHAFNTMQEIEYFVSALRSICSEK